jgi:hypothetical protein
VKQEELYDFTLAPEPGGTCSLSVEATVEVDLGQTDGVYGHIAQVAVLPFSQPYLPPFTSVTSGPIYNRLARFSFTNRVRVCTFYKRCCGLEHFDVITD